MDCKLLRNCVVLVLLFCLSTGSLSDPSFLSDGSFGSQPGRGLLQEFDSCPVNFVFRNYTIITSKCKGPPYPAELCCPALLEFACPYSEHLKDLSNNCVSIMFAYINLFGRYPQGLFANKCNGGKQGVACEALLPSQLGISFSGVYIAVALIFLLVILFLKFQHSVLFV